MEIVEGAVSVVVVGAEVAVDVAAAAPAPVTLALAVASVRLASQVLIKTSRFKDRRVTVVAQVVTLRTTVIVTQV